MSPNVSISYRGATYAIGQGPHFYGIWHAAAPEAPPLEWWPHTPEGWSAAWARFAAIEVPGTIVAVTERAAAPVAAPSAQIAREPAHVAVISWVSAAMLAAGVLLGIIGLFPTYIDGSSLAHQAFNLVPHVIYLTAWTLSAVLILLGGSRLPAGSLVGLGVSGVTLGLFLADAGTPIAGGDSLMGAGLVLSILGWLACTAGVVLAFTISRAGRPTRRPTAHEIVPTATLLLAGLGAAIAFAPSWDRFMLQTAAGATQTITAGNAFANPGPVIAGDVVVMIALVAAIAVAALWRPIRLGAALLAGALIPMVAQAISAVVELAEPTSPLQFGISQAQANQLGLTISGGFTPMFWVYCAFLITLMLLGAWMLVTHDSARAAASPWQSPSGQSHPSLGTPGAAATVHSAPTQ